MTGLGREADELGGLRVEVGGRSRLPRARAARSAPICGRAHLRQSGACVEKEHFAWNAWATVISIAKEGACDASRHSIKLQARLAAERRGSPFLLYRDGEDTQRIVDLDRAPERLTIGRSRSNGVVLEWDAEVSRVHVTLERLGGVDAGRRRALAQRHVPGRRAHSRPRPPQTATSSPSVGRTSVPRRGAQPDAAHRGVDHAPVPSDLGRPVASADRALPPLRRARVLRAGVEPADSPRGLALSLETVKSHIRALFDAFKVGEHRAAPEAGGARPARDREPRARHAARSVAERSGPLCVGRFRPRDAARPAAGESRHGAIAAVYVTMIVVVISFAPVPISMVCVPRSSAFRTTTQPCATDVPCRSGPVTPQNVVRGQLDPE